MCICQSVGLFVSRSVPFFCCLSVYDPPCLSGCLFLYVCRKTKNLSAKLMLGPLEISDLGFYSEKVLPSFYQIELKKSTCVDLKVVQCVGLVMYIPPPPPPPHWRPTAMSPHWEGETSETEKSRLDMTSNLITLCR